MVSLEPNPFVPAGTRPQPMSMMTIKAKPSDDLLTIRILESSERKLQMIKQLLTPEEFDSLAPNLLISTEDDNEDDYDTQATDSIRGKQLRTRAKRSAKQELSQRIQAKSASLHPSSSFIGLQQGKQVGRKPNVRERLLLKQQAIEFFFVDGPRAADQRELAIELRSSYYLSSKSLDESNLVQSNGFCALDRIYSLLELVGLKLTSRQAAEAASENEQKFKQLICDRASTLAWPYNRPRNIEAMKRRLVSSGQIDRILRQSEVAHKLGQYCNKPELKTSFEQLKSLDSNYHSARTLEPVGHFVRLGLTRASPVHSATSKWVEEELIKTKDLPGLKDKERIRLTSDLVKDIQNNSYLSNRYLSFAYLRLQEIVVLDCELMSQEERLALSLADQWQGYSNLRKELRKLLGDFKQLASRFDRENPIDLKRKFDSVLAQCEKFSSARQELLSTARELGSERKEQNFCSTSTTVDVANVGAGGEGDTVEQIVEELLINLKEIYNKLVIDCTDKSMLEQYELLIDYFDHCLDTKRELMQAGGKKSLQMICFNPNGCQITPKEMCPNDEADRRNRFENWIRSLELRILIGRDYYYDCQLQAIGDTQLFNYSLRSHILLVPVAIEKDGIEVEFELVQAGRSATMKLKLVDECLETSHVLGSKQISLVTNNSQPFVKSRTELIPSNGSDRSIAKLSFDLSVDQRDDLDLCKRVDRLYRSCFAIEHTCDNIETKLNRLINSPEHRAKLLDLVDAEERGRFSDLLAGLIDSSSIASVQTATLRRPALLWHQLSKQLVALDSSEERGTELPVKVDEVQLGLLEVDFEVELQKLGYKSIDLTRKRATTYLRQCERRLEQLISARSSHKTPAEHSFANHPASLLSEPQIKTLDVSGVARAARKMVPKRSAPRPLRPKRKLASKATMVDATVALMASLNEKEIDLERGQARKGTAAETDLSRTVAKHWRQQSSLHSLTRPSDLRLVVAVQQVTNAPLRIVRHAPAAMRASSPYPSAFSRTFGGAMSPASRPMSPAAGSLINTYALALPNTYVEIVFQRRKLATSLAYGKDPVWNETLFFPIQSAAAASTRLADESLQLNFYDCQCHPKSDSFATSADEQQVSHLASISETLAGGRSPSASQLVATQQRVERHLLGSLTVPLTILLTSGRLEGSFALNQPLLLDEYQFDQVEAPMLVANTLNAPASQSRRRRQLRALMRRAQTSFVSLFVTLDPPVSVPLRLYLPPSVCCPNDNYLAHFYHYCRLFEQVTSTLHSGRNKLAQPFPATTLSPQSHIQNRVTKLARADRNVRAVVWNESGRVRVVCAYLRPLERLAPEVLDEEVANSVRLLWHRIARFVSLLSPLKYGIFNERLLAPSVWFSCGQMLASALGGAEEKAVLLCNYFLQLGRCSALLFGDSLPDGRSVFVIVWRDHLRAREHQTSGRSKPVDSSDFIDRLPILIKSNTVELWDPNTGKCYAISSNQTPLLSVGSIATVENVYANIQMSDQAHEISFDIRISRCWLALLERSSASGTISTDILAKQLNQAANSFDRLNSRKKLALLEQLRRSFDFRWLQKSVLEPVDHFGGACQSSPEQPRPYLRALSREQCDGLRDAIERQIRASLISWRVDRPTYMNRTLSRMISSKLAQFEALISRENARESELDDDDYDDDNDDDDSRDLNKELAAGSDSNEDDWRSQLSEVLRNEVLALGSSVLVDTGVAQVRRKLISYPANVAFTSMRSILDLVYASNVHAADLMLTDHSASPPIDSSISQTRTQFLIASHVEAYPARVCSVWLYVGAIVALNPSSSSLTS